MIVPTGESLSSCDRRYIDWPSQLPSSMLPITTTMVPKKISQIGIVSKLIAATL